MPPENDTPADDLRAILAKSFDDSMSSTAVADGVVKPADTAAAADVEPKVEAEPAGGEPSDDGRARDASGKFVKKDGDDKPAAKPEAKAKEEPKEAEAKPEGDKAAAAEPKTDDKAPSATTGAEPPANWAASDKAMFKLQSPEAQAFLLRTVKNLEAGFTKKTNEIADLRKDYEPVQKLFAPYTDVLKQKGLTPHTVIQRWADVETKLANGGGIDIIDGLVKGYGIDKAKLAQRLGFTSAQAAQPSTEGQQQPGATEDPLDQKLAALERRIAESFGAKLSKIDQWETQQQTQQLTAAQQREAAVETEITNFKSATNAQGELLHPYYDEVEQAMIALAQSYVASKQPLPKLDELYETAVWANPSTRAAILASQRQAEEAKRTEEAKAKAASARRAASSVTGAPGSGQAARQVRGELSLREQLAEAAADLM